MAEEKKIENAVYEYDVLEERTERRPAAVTPYEREICQHMEGLFPHRVTRVYREIDSEFLSVKCFRDESTHRRRIFMCCIPQG